MKPDTMPPARLLAKQGVSGETACSILKQSSSLAHQLGNVHSRISDRFHDRHGHCSSGDSGRGSNGKTAGETHGRGSL